MNDRRPLYILDENGEPVPCDDTLTWARWFESADEARTVAQTEVLFPDQPANKENTVLISTVFLGIGHSYSGDGPPLLYETMVFGGPKDLDQSVWRHATKAQALSEHERVVGLVREAARSLLM